MSLRSIGVSIMRRIRRIAAGGFKINGPPRVGKGPMNSKEVSDTSNKASPVSSHPGGEDRNMHGVDKASNEVPRKQR